MSKRSLSSWNRLESLESLGIIVHRPISLPFDGSSTSDLGWEALQE